MASEARAGRVIIVTGEVIANSGMIDQALAVATAHVFRSRTEPGCISHNVYRDSENPDRMFFFERWSDMDALRAHFSVPASAETVAKFRELARDVPTIQIYDATKAQP